ncbi:MAG: HAD family hydrolase [Candidatus Cryptobacteroides sp.]|jgi:phosphoglycolate phosphatase
MNIELVILDFDGTIGDTNEVITETMLGTMAELGLEPRSREACNATIGLPLAECFRVLYPELPDNRIECCAETYRRLFVNNRRRSRTTLFPHVKETLKRLKSSGIQIAIASSRRHESLEMMVDEVGIREYVSFLIGTDEVEHPKPEPDMVLKTLAHFGVDAARALVVGDAPYDILMGKSAGCRTCAVTYGNGSLDELRAAGPDQLIDNFADILQIPNSVDVHDFHKSAPPEF